MSIIDQVPDQKRLTQLFPLRSLTDALREETLAAAELLHVDTGDILCKQGNFDNSVLYLLKGSVDLYHNDKHHSRLKHSQKAALHPLAEGRPRAATVMARTASIVLKLDANQLDTCLIWAQSTRAAGDDPAAEDERWFASISRSGLLAHVPPTNLTRILDALEKIPVAADDTIIRQGEPGDYYYIVREGKCEITHRGDGGELISIAQLGPGDTFGEEALVSGLKRNATVRMISDGALARMTKDAFTDLIRRPALQCLDYDAAQRQVDDRSATWLDLREPPEPALKRAHKTTLDEIRQQIDTLGDDQLIITICNDGRRASVAALLLIKHGINAAYVSPQTATRTTDQTTSRRKVPSVTEASLVAADVVNARTEVDAALHKKAVADAALAATVQQQEALRDEEDNRQLENTMERERRKYEREANSTQTALRRAQKTRLKVERIMQGLQRLTREQVNEARKRQMQLSADANRTLRNGEERLADAYKQVGRSIDDLHRLRSNTEQEMQTDLGHVQQRLYQAQARQQELQRQLQQADVEVDALQQEQRALSERHVQKVAELEQREQELRRAGEARLREERQRLEADFAESMSLLEAAREAQQQGEALQIATEETTDRVVARANEQQEALRRETNKRLAEQQRVLDDEVGDLRTNLHTARRHQQEAETQQRLSERRLQGTPNDRSIQKELKRRAAEVEKARAEVTAARDAQIQNRMERAIIENTRSGRTTTENTLRKRIEEEVDEWAQQEESREFRADRELKSVRNHVKRVVDRIDKEKAQEKAANNAMFDEIRQMLDDE